MSEQRSSAESAQPDDLEQVISSLLRNHSSPTIGQGSIHGGQVGWVLYEPNLAFVVAGIRRYLTKTTVRTEPQSAPATVSIRREWLEHVISVLQGDLPSGRIGDVVFLLRDQLRDILDRPAFARSQAEIAEAIEAEQDERRRVFGPFSWDEPQAESAK